MKTRIGPILILIALLLGGLRPPAVVQAQSTWYDTDWQYRRPVTVSNSGTTALTDYQILVSLDASFDFDNAAVGGADVRFTGGDSTTLLPFWIETWDPVGETARIWVSVPSVPTGESTLYLYYGNPGATAASDGDATFEFFDDFESPTTALGYYSLSEATTVLAQDQIWENTAPHTLSVVEVNQDGYQYWGYYALQAGDGGVGLARSNDLLNWAKYGTNPLFSNGRFPSVIKEGDNYYMAVTKDYASTSHVVLRTSTDGLNFTENTTLVSPVGGERNQNPCLFHNPVDDLYYLYWFRNSGSLREIRARSSTTVEGLASASDVVVLSSTSSLAAPNMMYYDETYFLATESLVGSEWQVHIYESATSPISGFSLLSGNPILEDGSACFFQHIFDETLHAYYCKLAGSTWTVDYRSADLTLGRTEVPAGLDPSKWTASGGTWTLDTAVQPDGSTGNVARGQTTARQILRSSFTGDDYVVEAFGQQVSDRVWGISVRATDTDNLYFTNLYEDLDTLDNLYIYGRVGGSGSQIASTNVGQIDYNTWYELMVKVHGSDIEAYLDGVLELQGTDLSLASGPIALYGENGTVALFDDVRVRKHASPEPSTVVGSREGPVIGDGWTYRRPVTIDNTGNPNALYDYQVKISLNSTNFDFSRAQSLGQDLRFTDSDGLILLDYWVEGYDATEQTATLWVKVPTIAASSIKTIYLYYGNPSATTVSDCDATFLFCDDFETSVTTEYGYYELSSPGVTVMVQDQGWETSAPHTLSVVELNRDGYQYWGYYSLQEYPDGAPLGLARSNDLVNWVKYDGNPILTGNKRWASVLKVDTTLYMAYTENPGTSRIDLATSSTSDGVSFTYHKNLVPGESGYYIGSPNLFLNPNDGLYYMYYVKINTSTNARDILVRSAATIEGLDAATPTIVHSSATTFSAPNMMYRDGTYFLLVETLPGGVWNTEAWGSDSPTSGFERLPGNPILSDGEACFFQHIFGDTLHGYYCKLTGSTWTLEYRTADLTAGRPEYEVPGPLDADKWTATGGTWTTAIATQQDGTSGVVAQGATSGIQLLRGDYSGTDYILEAYGQQISGYDWGLAARVTDAQNFYASALYDNHDNDYNLYLYNWTPSSHPYIRANLGVINPNTWYKMTVKVHGNDVEVLINDTPRLQTTWTTHPTGGVALYGEAGNTAQFNNVLVREYTSPEPTVTVGSEEPTAITLASFTAEAEAGRILLNWETAMEVDTSGFNLYRSGEPAGSYVQLNEALIPSQVPGTLQGAAYAWEDAEAEPGRTYYYTLEVVDNRGANVVHGPVSATMPARVIYSIYLPVLTK